MSDVQHRTLERLDRLLEAMADLTESHAIGNRNILRMLTEIERMLTEFEAHTANMRSVGQMEASL